MLIGLFPDYFTLAHYKYRGQIKRPFVSIETQNSLKRLSSNSQVTQSGRQQRQ